MTVPMGSSSLLVAKVIGSARVPVPSAFLWITGYAISVLPGGSLSRAPYRVTKNLRVWPAPPGGAAGALDGFVAVGAGAGGALAGPALGGSDGVAGAGSEPVSEGRRNGAPGFPAAGRGSPPRRIAQPTSTS